MSNPEIVSMMETLGYAMNRLGKEYHGNCPSCQDPKGEDRFVVFADGNAYCRRCEKWWSPAGFQQEFFKQCGAWPVEFRSKETSAKKSSSVRIISPRDPCPLWCDAADKLVNAMYLREGSLGVQELERRGIRPDFECTPNPVAAGLGYIPRDIYPTGSEWGLSKDFLWIPQGLLIPTYWYNKCVKLKVRRLPCDDGMPKYIEISGSSNRSMVLGYHEPKVALVVESELDAVLCMQVAADLVWTVAVGGASKPVDEETGGLLRKASLILWSMDQDGAGRERYRSWRGCYPQLRAWPADRAKSPGDMKRDLIRPWIEQGLKHYALL